MNALLGWLKHPGNLTGLLALVAEAPALIDKFAHFLPPDRAAQAQAVALILATITGLFAHHKAVQAQTTG